MSAALPNAVVPTNSEYTDDDYFAFTDSADTETSQAASDTTNNKCDLEVLQFLDDSKIDLKMLNRDPVVKRLFVQHNAVSVILSSSRATLQCCCNDHTSPIFVR